jgi:hypothetical protein
VTGFFPLVNSSPPTAQYTNLSTRTISIDSVINKPTKQIPHPSLHIQSEHLKITADGISNSRRFPTVNEVRQKLPRRHKEKKAYFDGAIEKHILCCLMKSRT